MSTIEDVYGKDDEMYALLDGQDPDVLAFRRAWERLEDAGAADGYGGMECRRRYLEWVAEGKPKKKSGRAAL